MSKRELRSALVRAVVLEHQNAKVTPFPRWGWERPTSMYVLRTRRLRVAKVYASRVEPVVSALFERQLPRGKRWPGAWGPVPPITSFLDA